LSHEEQSRYLGPDDDEHDIAELAHDAPFARTSPFALSKTLRSKNPDSEGRRERAGRITGRQALVEFPPHSLPCMSDERAFPSDPRGTRASGDDSESTFDLIDRARAGDQWAIERLFARHLKPLQRWATGRLPPWARDLADTEDLVQDVLLQTFKRIDTFEVRRVGALQAYLRQAVLNRVRDELRRKARRPDATDLDGLEQESAASPLEEAIGREGVERYQHALQRLKPEEREAIIGRIEMGYSYEELAQVLGKPTGEAARKAAQRALVRLAEEMKRVSE
jgi:RNA polymerase sigma factor (sigma-70 family)